MITIDEAVRLVLDSLPRRRVETVYFQAALGRVLAEDVTATMNIPPFRRAAMDGFAVRSADVEKAPSRLRCVGEIRAGGGNAGRVGPGEAMAIMTGAPVPEGADAVQMVEQTERSGSGNEVVMLKAVRPGENVAPVGSEAVAGEIVLEAGRLIGPGETAVLATFGYSQVKIYAAPSVALIATGDELVEVEEAPQPDQIRNSNAYSLASQLRLMGLAPVYLGIARDDRKDLHRLLLKGLESDVLILTGGVSMGEYDLVKEVFNELGLEILFTQVAMKPGKPTVFARKDDKLIFGLPGNPVSTFVAFENFVRPALGRMCGHAKPELLRVKAELLREIKQAPGRTAFLPAWVAWEGSGWKVEPFKWKGSADIIGFARSNSTVIFPSDRDLLTRGEIVDVMLLPDFAWRARIV